MPKEYEAKFLNIDIDAVKKILRKNGAHMTQKPTKYKRMIFKRCEEKGDKPGFVRVREEGNKVTMTTKVFDNKKFPEEHEVVINETFDKGKEFLSSIGVDEKSYQETFREKWSHPLAHEITFDIVPGLPIYMEVDCTDEKKLNRLVNLLKLDKKDMQYGSYDKTFTEYYNIPSNTIIHKTPKLTFSNVKREIKPKKNLDLFREIVTLNKTLKSNRLGSYYKKYKTRVYNRFFNKTNHKVTRKKKHTMRRRRPSSRKKRKTTRKRRGGSNNERNDLPITDHRTDKLKLVAKPVGATSADPDGRGWSPIRSANNSAVPNWDPTWKSHFDRNAYNGR